MQTENIKNQNFFKKKNLNKQKAVFKKKKKKPK